MGVNPAKKKVVVQQQVCGSIFSFFRGKPRGSSGFTLVEIMVGFAIFSIVAMGLSTSAIFSMRMAHLNVMRTTAFASAQGFLEQIKVIPEEDILAAINDPDKVPLPTRSISVLQMGSAIDIDDPIFLEDPNATTKGQNFKQIVVDI